jgi:hypothetical protein
MRIANPINLTNEEQQTLERYARGRSIAARLVLRAKIILRAGAGIVLVQRELDKRFHDGLLLLPSARGFVRHKKALNCASEKGTAEVNLPSRHPFVALVRLSLAGCTSAEPASVSPADGIVVGLSIFVKCLFITMPSSLLYGCLSRR